MTQENDFRIYDPDMIGERIAKKRMEKNMSQEKLGRKLNVSQNLIAKIETGTRNISNDLLIRLVDVLDTNTDYILRGIDSQNVKASEELNLNNEAINYLHNLKTDGLMIIDNTAEALNFFLSDRNGFSVISQLYAYLCSDCLALAYDKENAAKPEMIPAERTKIPVHQGTWGNGFSSSYHLTADDYSNMMLQKIMDNMKEWKKEISKSKKGDQ